MRSGKNVAIQASRRGPGSIMRNLVQARFLRRYKRFFADCRLADGREVVAHCPNTGSMKTLLGEGRRAWLRPSDDPRRKLAWTLVFLEVERGERALIDTALPNRIVAEAVLAAAVPELPAPRGLRREPRLASGGRVDLFLEPAAEDHPGTWVEIKNVTMRSARVENRADFPDAVTSRGARHLDELRALAEAGERALQFFLLGRGDCDRVGLAREIDPAYAAALQRARDAGVEFLAYDLDLAEGLIRLGRRVPIDLD